jgi:hypothetical protein
MPLATDSTEFQRTLAEGAQAFDAGEPPTACPYGPFCDPDACQSAEHYGWLVGWNLALLESGQDPDGYLVIDLGEPTGSLH